jgi:ABC-type phosphate transport system substrate-binding protein
MIKTTTIESRRRHRHRWFAVAVLAMICAQAPLAFAAQSVQENTGNVRHYQLHGSGTTNPSKLIWLAMDKLEEMAGSTLRMTYRSVGSGTGATDWASANAGDFASTDYGLAADSSAPFMQLPFQIGAVSLFHNVPGVGTGVMKLSACTVAKIFTGAITNWNHADIAADSGLTLPSQTIKVIARSNGSSSTYGLRGYMNAACPTVFTGAVDATALTGNFVHTGVTGSDSMRLAIGSNEYSIGYIDAGHGHLDNLSEVSLKNANNQWVVTKEGDPAGRLTAKIKEVGEGVTFPQVTGTLNTDWSGDWSGINLYYKSGDKFWPICAFTYLHVRTTYAETATAGVVRAFVEYMLSSAIQDKITDFYFYPLPGALAAAVRNAVTDHFTSAVAAPIWTFVDSSGASAPATNVGMGVHTFSYKRQTYADYERGLFKKNIAALEASVAALKTELAAKTGNDDAADERTLALAAISFVVAVIAVIVGSIAMCRGGRSSQVMRV